MILASLRGLAVPLVLSAAARLARTASLHFDSVSYSGDYFATTVADSITIGVAGTLRIAP